MTFKEYIKDLFSNLLLDTIFKHRKCETCMGSKGNCDKCNPTTRDLYKRDWGKWHNKKFIDRKDDCY